MTRPHTTIVVGQKITTSFPLKEEHIVNGPEIFSHCRHQLATSVAAHCVAEYRPLPISAWLASALLQKAIRRGRLELALAAAATLLRESPDRLWRRCCGIAFEDVGLADQEAVAMATVAAGGKRVRAEIGGEWKIASYIVSTLTSAKKCRAADDLLMCSQQHPRYNDQRKEFASLPTPELLAIAANSNRMIERAIALALALGTNRFISPSMPVRRGEPNAVFDWMCEGSFPHSLVEIARAGFRRGAGILAPLVVLLSSHIEGSATSIANDDLPPESLINDIPGWALDIYSREGRAALGHFLEQQIATADWVRGRIAPAKRIKFLGEAVFRVEGCLLANRLRWPLADELRQQYEVQCLGVEDSEAQAFLDGVRSDIPRLNRVRGQTYRGSDHAK